MLYDADKVLGAAATPDPRDLYHAQLSVFLDPDDPGVQAEAAAQGIPADWLDAARRSPVHALIARHRVALPLHPEYRTLPMVWYIPPLSPVADVVHAAGYDDADPDQVFAAIEALRVPAEYLANLFTAGDPGPVRRVLRTLAAVRTQMRAEQLGLDVPEGLAESVGASEADLADLYRLLAIAKYDERYVIPPAHAEDAGRLMAQHEQLFCAQPGGPDSFHPPAAQEFRDGDGRLHLEPVPPGPVMTASPYKLASVLLQYPTTALFDGLGVLEAEAARLPRPCAAPLGRFLGWLRETPPSEVAQHYVATFDLRRRCALYLTYYRYGDTRKRGMAMLAFKAAYRAAGFEPSDSELPDYLPLVLDFAALHPRGEKLLRAHRADLELLLRALRDAPSPYADVIEAVCAQLPALRRPDQALVRRFWESGPPAEEVGLEPFAPPEYMEASR